MAPTEGKSLASYMDEKIGEDNIFENFRIVVGENEKFLHRCRMKDACKWKPSRGNCAEKHIPAG